MEPGHLKVAFASNDPLHADADFGSARRLAFFDVSVADANSLGEVDFEAAPGSSTESSGVSSRLAAITGCDVLFVTRPLNGEVASAMIKNKVFAVKLEGPTPISDVIRRMQSLMSAHPPRWLRKALREAPHPEAEVV